MGVDAALLRSLSPFSILSEDQLGKIAGLCAKKIISAGQVFFQEGKSGTAIFVVLQNDVEVLFTADGDALACIVWVGTGEMLGIRAFFPPYRYLSTARSLTESCLLAIDAVKLHELIQQDSRLAVSIHECFMEAILKRVAGLRTKI